MPGERGRRAPRHALKARPAAPATNTVAPGRCLQIPSGTSWPHGRIGWPMRIMAIRMRRGWRPIAVSVRHHWPESGVRPSDWTDRAADGRLVRTRRSEQRTPGSSTCRRWSEPADDRGDGHRCGLPDHAHWRQGASSSRSSGVPQLERAVNIRGKHRRNKPCTNGRFRPGNGPEALTALHALS